MHDRVLESFPSPIADIPRDVQPRVRLGIPASSFAYRDKLIIDRQRRGSYQLDMDFSEEFEAAHQTRN